MDNEIKLLNDYWPLLFVLGAAIPILILLALGWLLRQTLKYLGPDVKEFFKSGVEANHKTATAVSEQGPLLRDTNQRVVVIEGAQGLSHAATHKSLQVSIQNQKSLARGLIEGMQALEQVQPELHQKFSSAMSALREIENR